jgi:hypothetical protein
VGWKKKLGFNRLITGTYARIKEVYHRMKLYAQHCVWTACTWTSNVLLCFARNAAASERALMASLCQCMGCDDSTYTVSIAHPTDATGLRVAFIKKQQKHEVANIKLSEPKTFIDRSLGLSA